MRAIGGQVDVWLAQLDEDLGAPDEDLPPADRERAGKFLRPQVAARWTASRWALRRVLSSYLDEPPARIGIDLGENGKPHLVGGELEFNLSHSGQLALIAVSREPVGIDVERIEPARDLLALAERALAEEEVAKVRAAAPAERAAIFYDAWTRHEARLKCLGTGLTGSPSDQRVAVQRIEVPSGYAAAVAVAGENVGQIRRRSLATPNFGAL